MQVDKTDVENLNNLVKTIMHKATLKLSGEEVLAFNQLVVWAVKFKAKMEQSLSEPAITPIPQLTGKKK